MAEESQELEGTRVPIFPSLLNLAIENNAMLQVLIRVVGELQAKSRVGNEATEDEIVGQIKRLYNEVDETKVDIIALLVKLKDE